MPKLQAIGLYKPGEGLVDGLCSVIADSPSSFKVILNLINIPRQFCIIEGSSRE